MIFAFLGLYITSNILEADSCLGTSIAVVFSIVIGLVLALLLGSSIPTELVIEAEYQLALDQIELVGDEFTFTYSIQQEDGGYQIETIKTDNVVVYEEDRESPLLVIKRRQLKWPIFEPFALYADQLNHELYLELYVPAGYLDNLTRTER